MKKLNLLFNLLLVVSAMALLSACSSMENTTSRWKTNEIKIDGNDNDWNGSLAYYEDQKAMIGVKNTDDFIYICFKTDDAVNIRKIMGMGLTVWLNNDASKSKVFGIHYPVGGREMFAGNSRNQQPDGHQLDTTNIRNKFRSEMLADIELQTGDNDIQKFSVAEAKTNFNISAALKVDNNVLTYELAIPFETNYNNINLKPGKENSIGVGFETGELKERGNRSYMGGGENPGEGVEPGEGGGPPFGGGSEGGYPGGGGMYPRGGFGGGHRHGGGSWEGNRQAMMEPLSLWIDVRLANQSGGSQ